MQGTTSASRRYLKRFTPAIVAYVFALFGAQYAIHTLHPTGAALVALAILPALPMIAVIGIIGLYVIEETDEYLRQRVVTGMLVGLALMLTLATAWGFLEEARVVPYVPSYWAFVIWCFGWGVTEITTSLRERLGREAA
jgi:xanthosine utilization system XapX-like protein